jgi:hypothetical protein
MAFELTEKARIEADKVNKEPQIVLEISGLDNKFNAVTLKKYVRVGDDELYIGDDWRIGGFNEVEDQTPYITFSRGTSNRIQQSIDQDKGETTTISSMSITVVDKNEEVSALLKPDETQSPVFDLLGKSCKVWLGFAESGWKDDYITIFRGFIESYKASGGYVTFNLSAVDKIVDSTILPKVEVELSAGINDTDTELPLSPSGQLPNLIDTSVGGFFGASTGIATYLRVDDELILVGDVGATSVSGCTRGQLGTTAVSHDSGSAAESIYELQGKPMDIAKRLLLGSEETSAGFTYGNRYIDAASGLITSFVRVSATRTESNGMFFRGVNMIEEYGINRGDTIATNFTVNPENDISSHIISDFELLDDGSTILYVEDSPFNGSPAVFVEEEPPASATMTVTAIDSGYWPIGLELSPDLVDVPQMNKLQDRFFSSTYLSFYVKDSMNVREFIEQELFKPLSLYRVPRNGKFSVQYHFPPLPDQEIPILDSSNVTNPSDLGIQRSTSQNFYNSIAIRYNEQALEDKFDSGYITTNATSTSRIPVGRKTFIIDGKGFRTDKTVEGNSTAGATYASTAADRRLNKYAFGAEFIKGMKVSFRTGYTLDIGDIVNVNLSDLKITDIRSGTRSGEARLFEIENKTLNIKTGEIVIDLVDTNFNLQARYALMSPASRIKSGLSGTQFVIEPRALQPTQQFGSNEYRKWSNKVGASVRVRNDDFSVSGVANIQSVVNNTITLDSDLGFTPAGGYTLELSKFNNQDSLVTNLYGFMNEPATGGFDDGTNFYQMV